MGRPSRLGHRCRVHDTKTPYNIAPYNGGRVAAVCFWLHLNS